MPLPRTLPKLLPALLMLGGCTLGPAYHRPPLPIPDAWRATPGSAEQAWPADDWWRGFGSAQLDQLIAEARAHNDDLQAAAARVVQADAQASIAGAPLLPSVTGNASGTYQRIGTGGSSRSTGVGVTTGVTSTTTGATSTGSSLGGTTGTTSNTATSTGSTVVATSNGGSRYVDSRDYRLNATVSYELDFWGKNRATAQAANALALGTRFDQATVALTVVTSVAQTWFQALAYADRLRIAEQNLHDAEQTLQVLRMRLQVGTATALDIAQQETLVAQQRQTIPSMRSQRDQQVIALGILIGLPPARVVVQPDTLFTLRTPIVSPGLPANLLARRPDVAYAEAQLVSQNGNVRAARAAFFPDVTLTGSAGFESLALASLFGPGTLLTSFAGNVTQTIFDNGLLQGELDQAKGRYVELAADYHKAVLQAFTDVDTALVAHREATEQEELAQLAASVAQRGADIARAQVAAGTVDVTTVLTAENSLYTAQDTAAQVRLLRLQSLLNLYKALGGGWTLPPGQEPK